MNADHVQPLAHAATTLSITATGFAWFAQVHEILQLVALGVAIVSGIYAIRSYRKGG